MDVPTTFRSDGCAVDMLMYTNFCTVTVQIGLVGVIAQRCMLMLAAATWLASKAYATLPCDTKLAAAALACGLCVIKATGCGVPEATGAQLEATMIRILCSQTPCKPKWFPVGSCTN